MTGMIAGVITDATKENIIPQLIKTKLLRVDFAGIRVDLFEKQDLKTIMEIFSEIHYQRNAGVKLPRIIATVRIKREGGGFKKGEEDRSSAFVNIISHLGRGDFIDIELYAEEIRDMVIRMARKQGLRVIVSYHNFEETPGYSKLKNIIKRGTEVGADIAKVGTLVNSDEDIATLGITLDTCKYEGKPAIILPMGKDKRCKEARLSMPFLIKNRINYGSIGDANAPGQPTVQELRNALNLARELPLAI